MQKQVFKDALGVAAYNYGYQAIIFASSVITGRLLTPAEYGFVALITVFTGFVAFFNDAGLSYIIIRSDYKGTFFRAMFMLSIVIGFVLFGVVALLAYPIALFQNSTELILPTLVVAIIIFIQTLSVVPSALLRKSLNFREKSRIDFWTNSTSTIITIVLAFAGASYWSLIFSQLYVAVSQFIWYNKSYNFRLETISFRYVKAAFKQTKSMLFSISGSRVINYWSNNFGNLIIGKIYGDASLGVYNRTYSLFNILSNLIAGVFQSVLLPSMKKMKDDGKNPDKEFYNFLDLVMILCLPAVFIFIFFGEFVISILWGKNWLEVGRLLPYFGVMALCFMPITVSYNMFILREKEKLLLRLNSASTLVIVASFVIGLLGRYINLNIDLETLVFCTTITYCLLILPMYFYPLFVNVMDIEKNGAILTWSFRVLLTTGLCLGIYFDYLVINIALMLIICIDLFFRQRLTVAKVSNQLLSRLKK